LEGRAENENPGQNPNDDDGKDNEKKVPPLVFY
jgi:hypothetical protein